MTRVNKTWDEISIGDDAQLTRVCTADDLQLFMQAAGGGAVFQNGSSADGIAPGMWLGSLIAGVIHGVLPGPGSLHVAQSLSLRAGATIGDELTTHVRVTAKDEANKLVELACSVTNKNGTLLVDGAALVQPPEKKLTQSDVRPPPPVLKRRDKFDRLVRAARSAEPMRMAVVFPTDEVSLRGVLAARSAEIVRPILVGPSAKIRAVATECGIDLGDLRIIDVEKPRDAAGRAVALVNEGDADAVMKGNVHSDDVLHAVVQPTGLRGERRVSHVFVMDVPGLDDYLLVSDAAINIAPTLDAKVDIVQNAIDLAHALGMSQPRVAVLSAVETVNVQIPSTLDAAALSKMAERGQIRGGTVDGPLAMDNAINVEAARTKGIHSLVAGRANVLIVPSLESGNMIAKELTFLAHADAAGVVVGAKAPVVLTSRADSIEARLASCAVAVLYRWYQTHGAPMRALEPPVANG